MEKDYARVMMVGSFVFALSSIAVGISAYLLRILLARTLEPAEYGLVFAIIAFFSVFISFRTLGFGAALVRFVPLFRKENAVWKIRACTKYLLAIQLAIMLLVAVGITIFAEPLAESYFKSDVAKALLFTFLAYFIVTVFSDTFEHVFYANNKIGIFALKRVIEQLLLLMTAAALLLFFNTVLVVPVAYLISGVLISIFMWILFRIKLKDVASAKTRHDKETFKKVFFFGLPQTFANIGLVAFTYFDTLILTFFRSLEEVAIYSVAQPVVAGLTYLRKPLVVALNPIAAELAHIDLKKLGHGFVELTKWMLLLLIPGCIVLALTADPLVNLLFGKNYAAAADIIKILVIGVPFASMNILNARIIFVTGSAKLNAILSTITGAISVVMNIILIPILGVIGAAIASVVSGLVSNIISSIILKKKTNIALNWSLYVRFAVSAISSIFAGLGIGLIIPKIWYVQIPFVAVIAAAAFFGAALILHLFTVKEAKSYWQKFRHRKTEG